MRKLRLMLPIGLAVITATAAAQSTIPGEISRASLVTTLRLLNTTEYQYRHDHDRFASREEMITYMRTRETLHASPVNVENPKPYALAITTSSDGEHYQITLSRATDMNDKSTWCHPAAFSDDRGVIYVGFALDCEEPTQK